MTMNEYEQIDVMYVGLNEFQTRSRATAVYPAIGNNFNYVALAMCGEVGEVANTYKKVLRGDCDGDPEKGKAVREKLIDELGDVAWYLAQCCSELQIPLGEVCRRNFVKLEERKKQGSLKGENRTPEKEYDLGEPVG